MKNLIVVVLLFCFGVLIAPRTIWHTHEDSHRLTLENYDQHQAHFEATDCFVCDYNLSLFTPHQFLVFKFLPSFHLPNPDFVSVARNGDYESPFYLRGPPNLI